MADKKHDKHPDHDKPLPDGVERTPPVPQTFEDESPPPLPPPPPPPRNIGPGGP